MQRNDLEKEARRSQARLQMRQAFQQQRRRRSVNAAKDLSGDQPTTGAAIKSGAAAVQADYCDALAMAARSKTPEPGECHAFTSNAPRVFLYEHHHFYHHKHYVSRL